MKIGDKVIADGKEYRLLGQTFKASGDTFTYEMTLDPIDMPNKMVVTFTLPSTRKRKNYVKASEVIL